MACCANGPCGRLNLSVAEALDAGPGLVRPLKWKSRCPVFPRVDETKWSCYLCYVHPSLFPTTTPIRPDLQKRDRAELRESKPRPDLSAPRAAAVALGQQKRHRVGPHR